MTFEGVKVLELAAVLAGPAVGMFLAEQGAEVIKVENAATEGDVTRSWRLKSESKEGLSAYFCSVNWGKKSISLDLRKQVDKEIVYALAKKADIVISSYIPGADKRLGVDAEALLALNPTLICAEINGYGQNAERAAFDAIIQAEAGFTYMNGLGNEIYKMPVALMDVLASHQLREAILLAWIRRLKTGKGGRVSVSLFESGVSSLINQATNWLMAKHIPQAVGSEHPNIVPYGSIYTTADAKKIVLAIGNDAQFQALCGVLGISAPKTMASNVERVALRTEVNSLLAEAIARQNAADLLQKLLIEKVPAGAVNDLEAVFNLPLAQNLLHQTAEAKGVKSFVAEGIPQAKNLLPPPHLDADREEILKELGISA